MSVKHLYKKPAMMVCEYCGGKFEDAETAFIVAHGTVHFSIPSFTLDTVAAYYHEKCWIEFHKETKTASAKH